MTRTLQLRLAKVVPWAVCPRTKFKSLQAVLESTYTVDNENQLKNNSIFVSILSLLCSPLFVPQIAGGEDPDGFVTVKVSVRHRLAVEISLAAPAEITFPVAFAKEVVKVDGPVMVKVSKSSLN